MAMLLPLNPAHQTALYKKVKTNLQQKLKTKNTRKINDGETHVEENFI